VITNTEISTLTLTPEEIFNDYRVACESRQASLLARKEVFMGKAKFGIFGDGKEIAQIAMAKVFRKGDWRSGYYRDQTFMAAIGELTWQQFFAQLYAHTDVNADPATAGRMMNGHFATRSLDEEGNWKNIREQHNSSADISPTAAQMPRLVGLGYASKLYRNNPALQHFTNFSKNGNEIGFGTIGNASAAEGIFLESVNAAGVLQIPVIISVWDDEFGISVPNEYQVTKGDISKILAGFQRTETEKGFEIFKVRGWDYEGLCRVYKQAAKIAREEHVPVLIHVVEMTQPQGHSTSGSHERYKSKERLDWEETHDPILQMRNWMLENGISDAEELDHVENEAKEVAKIARAAAWQDYTESLKHDYENIVYLLRQTIEQSHFQQPISKIHEELTKTVNPLKQDTIKAAKKALRWLRTEDIPVKYLLQEWLNDRMERGYQEYSSHLLSESEEAAWLVEEIKPEYHDESPLIDGRQIMQACFDDILKRDPKVFIIGEDVGKIGDVNQGLAGMQEKYGEIRVTDTGIRETSIIGQGIGAALRGLRPITEIQYLDYIYFALQTLADDLACLHYRTKGGQKSPLIIRTRGHRLEGTWHSGSPMGAIINSIRGIHVLVPRNMTQAAGFYNTLLKSDEPALVIECLNGYRLKERLPDNIGEICTPLGIPETLRHGNDITIVTYGSMCRMVMEAAQQLAEVGIDVEVIDVQSLLPFDRHHKIVDSLKKTNRILFADEDVPGGATAFMMQQVLEVQNGYSLLDSAPRTLTAKDHRPAYASDGDYFSKPSVEDIFDIVYEMMQEVNPQQFPAIY
jgi:pyruvate/2-oxoglutarate/acetoin dehydrogenase E1 component/TPP-dependent pyruvate/acetoin dehydrogenase alpha subunit